METPSKARQERRNLIERAAVVRGVVNAVIENPSVTLTVDTLRAWLDLPVDAAERILRRLVSSGVMREINRGMYVGQPIA